MVLVNKMFGTCVFCKQEKLLVTHKSGCWKCYMRKYRLNNPDYVKKSTEKSYIKNRDNITIKRYEKIKVLGGKCSLCGIDNFLVLTIHHKDINHDNNSDDNLMVLCHNCHHVLHTNNKFRAETINWLLNNTNTKIPSDIVLTKAYRTIKDRWSV
jgi:5-methylcytosine-specific restriction endonuclease McrA